MKNIFRIVLAVAAIAITAQVTPVAAQDNNLVTGIVVDKYDSPIPGVLVARKGASKKHFVSDVTGVAGSSDGYPGEDGNGSGRGRIAGTCRCSDRV